MSLAQMLSGVVCLMFYDSDWGVSWWSIELMRRSLYWYRIVNVVHGVLVSVFYIVVSLHVFKYWVRINLSRRMLVVSLGIVWILLLFAVTFLGYGVTGGIMGYWAIRVILNLIKACVWIGVRAWTCLVGDSLLLGPMLLKGLWYSMDGHRLWCHYLYTLIYSCCT